MDIRGKYREKVVVTGGEDERLDAILARTKFDLSKPPEKDSPVFFVNMGINEYPVAYPGSLGLLIGAQKVRKTTALKAIAASAIGGTNIINFMFRSKKKGKIAFFDTEQRFRSFWQTQSQTHYLSGLINNSDRYDAFTFIDESIEDRFLLIERYVKLNEDIEMMVIDGALDIVEDFNDIREARVASERIARIANNSKAVVFVVVHASGKFGKGPANSLGHLGSQLERKCDFAIHLSYNKDTQFTEVEHQLSRSFGKFPNFEFTNDRNGYPVLDHNQKVALPYPLNLDSGGPVVNELSTSDPFAAPFTPQKVMTVPSKMNDDEDIPF